MFSTDREEKLEEEKEKENQYEDGDGEDISMLLKKVRSNRVLNPITLPEP